MRLSVITNLIDFLTLDRARVYAVLTMVLGFCIAFSLWVTAPERFRNSVDFPAFYNAGRIINEYPRGSLYDRELQQTLYQEIAPAAAARTNLFFVYTPFFAVIFAPLALMPYLPAFVCWVLISLALFTVGFRLAWTAASLPVRYLNTGFVLALGFLPLYSWCLFIGQTSTFGFFWLALAIYLDRRGRGFVSGCALAMLLYKPTLLLLLVPMLVVTKRWRTVAGFCVGAVVLGLVSLAVIGFSGIPAYLDTLAFFSRAKATGLHLIWFDVDALSFFLPLLGKHAWLAALALAAVVIPFLLRAWRRDPEDSFALAITWTLVLNFYVVIYDSTLIILAVVLTAGSLAHPYLPRGFRWLLLALFLVPWVARQSAQNFGFQPMTIALVAFGCYQLSTILSRQRTLVT
jgi:alpha-1,2-mannosyltransferase